MKLMTISAAALAATFVFAQSAQAREHHRHHGLHRDASRHWSQTGHPSGQQQEFGQEFGPNSGQDFAGSFWNNSQPETSRSGFGKGPGSGLGGRPSAWCGWEMRQLVSSDPGQEFNLARNWVHWGQSGPAGVGAVVVWPHHVGKIVGQQDGNWIIESGNDGHALRTRPRSIAGAIAIRWG
jgi:hypothetical protein